MGIRIVLLLAVLLAGCSGRDNPATAGAAAASASTSSSTGRPGQAAQASAQAASVPASGEGRVFAIHPGADATTDMVAAMVQAAPGDVIQFDCGYFDLSTSLQLINTEDVTIRGCGRDQTVLSFRNSDTPNGILIVNVRGIWIEDLTVVDSGGNGIEMRGVDFGTVRRARALWSSGGGRASKDPISAANYTENDYRRLRIPCTKPAIRKPGPLENVLLGGTRSPDYTMNPNTGRYGVYPVLSKNVLIEDSEAIGASDAGLYIGQSNNVIMRNNRTAFNPFGFEIENVQGGEYDRNLAECNTGGMLIYDLDGLTQYGDRTLVHDNIIRNNNSYNVAEHPGLVRLVPAGTGIITLSYDRIDIVDNEITGNNTVGILHTSYAVFPASDQPTDRRLDGYSEGVHIYRNRFADNGNLPALPTTVDLLKNDVIKIFPLAIAAKNAAACLQPRNLLACTKAGLLPLRGAHILWDGLADDYDPNCPYPVDASGNPLPKDERGKPVQGNRYPNPACHYNGYKFDTTVTPAKRLKPDWFMSCIDDDNVFAEDSLRYSNFHGTKGYEILLNSNIDPAKPLSVLSVVKALDLKALTQFAADFDMTPHQCVAQYGRNLAPLAPIVIPPFVRSGNVDPGPSPEEVARLCGSAVASGKANFAAAPVDCPTLDQYHLFANAEDPTSAPNEGTPYVLTSKLFSDYAVKYRVAYLPPGTQAIYNDRAGNGVDATLVFPVGTIIAKTFSFGREDRGTETPAETRLLIKRVTSKGLEHWDGASYLWSTDPATGRRVAKLALGGAKLAASWDLSDVDSGVHHVGSTDSYLVPNRAQCLSCHSATNKEPGASPIGPKVRFLNRPYAPESRFSTGQSHPLNFGVNQIAWLCGQGLLAGCPADLGIDATTQIATRLERVPTFNKPGDSGFAANSAADIEARARAYLEVNCQHCHNANGFAASTGFYLDSFRKVDGNYGICKQPTAAGAEGSGGRSYDIQPGAALKSILDFRIGPNAKTPAARMPPLARSVVHDEGAALIRQWIDTVVTADDTKYPGSTSCAGK